MEVTLIGLFLAIVLGLTFFSDGKQSGEEFWTDSAFE